jgi:hypothetical protein
MYGAGWCRSCVGSCLNNDDIGGNVGWGNLLGSPLSGPCGYAVGGGGGLPWPWGGSDNDIMADLAGSQECSFGDAVLQAAVKIAEDGLWQAKARRLLRYVSCCNAPHAVEVLLGSINYSRAA